MKNLFLIQILFFGFNLNIHAQSDSTLIVEHLRIITKTDGYRNYQNINRLNQTAKYILSVFQQYADTAYYQPYQVKDVTYKNVVCRIGSANDKPLVIVGAHYDVCGDQEGADDNASGIVGLLELVRLLSDKKINYPIEIVAYSLEEPPYFRSEYMGSYIHAQSLFNAGTPVYGMVVLEMIGYFSDRAKSQSYPVKVMKVAYGTTGNFILLARKTNAGEFVKKFSAGFKHSANIDTKSLKAPSKLQGIDFSDHLNYWNFGYDALMVTNTAFYRNHNYHHTSDKMETLDIPKMMKVIDTAFHALLSL
ncbi:MAG: M28 family peptidase [Prevotellaceae bacterium]|jgi:Zn-dependent M28 family amino/carboxypeptidase|nr:M28 family peptidase [Prevotellaceae bacterium]